MMMMNKSIRRFETPAQRRMVEKIVQLREYFKLENLVIDTSNDSDNENKKLK